MAVITLDALALKANHVKMVKARPIRTEGTFSTARDVAF